MEGVLFRLFLVSLLWLFAILAAVFFYFCRLEKIQGLRMSQVFGMFLLAWILDVGSFGWSFRVSGGEIVSSEINLLFRFLAELLPPETVFFLILIPFTVAAFALFYGLLLRWLPVQEARRAVLIVISASSVISLVGTATNVAFAIFGWQSPLLIRI